MNTIFIVDDNDANLFAAQKALSKQYNVFTLPSADAMFELISDVTPDLILLDIQMPGMDGFEAMEILKEKPEYANIPVIFLTGQVDLETEIQGLEMGAVDFIPKPFSEPVLLNRIKAHMDIDALVRDRTQKLQKQVDELSKQVETLKKQAGALQKQLDKSSGQAGRETKKWMLDAEAIIEETQGFVEEKIALSHLDRIMNGINSAVCVTDPEVDEILFINASMAEAFNVEGYCVGKKCYNVLRGFDERCHNCPCTELDKNPGEEIVWEQHNKRTGRIYRCYSKYIDWPGGKTVHIQSATDITDIKQSQEELENQNIRLNLLVGGLNIGFWDRTVDPSQAYDDNKAEIWWSDEFRQLLGYTDESEFPNEIGAWLDCVHPEDLQMTLDALTAFLGDKTGKTPYDIENRMKTKSGEYRWFRSFGSAIRDADGNPIRTAGATEDITRRKQAEHEIIEKGDLNKILFDNAPVGLTVFDENYRFVDCNENILKMFGGITREHYSVFFGSPDHSPEHQPDGSVSFDKAMDIITNVIKTGEKVKTEFVHNIPGGGLLPVELTLTRIKQDEKYLGLAYIYDLSEQYKLKEEIEEALREAENANKAKSDFLARMSHEIRTPMNAILGVTEILMRSDTLAEDVQESLGKIYESGNLLMGIINDILDLSKIEAEKLEILPVKYDVPSLINDTVQLNRLRYDSKPIEFSISLDENTPHDMIGDELRIKQILNNLLSNAYKYTDEGEIELSVFYEDMVEKTDDFDTILIMEVKDTGQGMTPEQLGELFTEYMRFNIETNRDTVGTGLGLSITKHLVDMMYGEITAQSVYGEGSVFTVRLPQKRVGKAVCGSELVEKLRNVRFQSMALTKKSQFIREYMPYGSVLVVDDVDSNTFVAKGMLLPYGLSIDTASSGHEAIKKIKGGKEYDIVFMDHMMPKMDGMETTKALREMGYKNTVIALTANALVGQSDMFLKSGFDGYISKPIDSRELNHVLNDYIRNKKPPEVVEKARREQASRKKKNAQSSQTDEDMAVMTVSEISKSNPAEFRRFLDRDIQRALGVINGIFSHIDSVSDEDKSLYTVTVHGMRGALATIGEKEPAAIAFRLEQAGKAWDAGVIRQETPIFINALKNLTEKLNAQEKTGDAAVARKVATSESDMAFLRKKLQTVKDACSKYDANTARAALEDLSKKVWPDEISDMLHEISADLLHSAFKKAAGKADNLMQGR